MSKDQQKKVLLGVLLVLLLVAAWRQFGPRITAGSGSREPGSRGQTATNGAVMSVVDSPEVVELRLEDLEKVAGQFRPGRDPFRFGESRAAEPEPTTSARIVAFRPKKMISLRRKKTAEYDVPPFLSMFCCLAPQVNHSPVP